MKQAYPASQGIGNSVEGPQEQEANGHFCLWGPHDPFEVRLQHRVQESKSTDAHDVDQVGKSDAGMLEQGWSFEYQRIFELNCINFLKNNLSLIR